MSQAGGASINYNGAFYNQPGGQGRGRGRQYGSKSGNSGGSSGSGSSFGGGHSGKSGQSGQQPGHFGGNYGGNGQPGQQQHGSSFGGNGQSGGRGAGSRGRGRRGRTATGQIICFRCGKTGHIAAKCQDAVVNVVEMEDHSTSQVTEEEPAQMFGAQFFNVDVKSVSSEQVYPTCKPIMTTLKFGSNKKITMECDTAASHNILSQESYQEIWPRGTGPKLTYRKVKVMLADGSKSAEQTRSME